jgi:hypothetical protein
MCNKKKGMRGGAYSTSMYPLHTNTSLTCTPALRCATKKKVSMRMAKRRIGCKKEAFAKFAVKAIIYRFIRCSNLTSQPGSFHKTVSIVDLQYYVRCAVL